MTTGRESTFRYASGKTKVSSSRDTRLKEIYATPNSSFSEKAETLREASERHLNKAIELNNKAIALLKGNKDR